MKGKDLYLSVFTSAFLLSYLSGVAQRDSLLARAGNARVNRCVDSIAKILDTENKTFLLFIRVDYLEQNAYGCIVKRTGDSIDAKKLLIDSNAISEKKVDPHLLQENRRLLLEFFNNTKVYLTPSFSDESINKLSHDNRTFFIVKNDGKLLYRGCFYVSDYTQSKNERIITLFLELTGMMTWYFPPSS